MSALLRLNSSRTFHAFLRQNLNQSSRQISNSQKNRGTATINQAIDEAACSTKKPWVSYGFDYKNEVADKNSLKSSFFFSVTMCLVWGTFIWSYLPDTQFRDWAQREGFLELRRREAAGEDFISPDYINPSQMNLPSDEDLGTTKIII